MNAFLLNIILAVIWAAATGSFDQRNLVIGFVIGYVILLFGQQVVGSSNYTQRVRQIAILLAHILWDLLLSNLRVIYDVVTPSYAMRPGVVAVPLSAKTDVEITAVANSISLTPGTLTLDVSDDRKVVYIHAMYIDDVESFRHQIKATYEWQMLKVLR